MQTYSASRTDKEGTQLYGDCTVHSTYRVGPINIIVVHDKYLDAWMSGTNILKEYPEQYKIKEARVAMFNGCKRDRAEELGEEFNA